MDSFNSTLFDLALNVLINENQAQDENFYNTETQTIIIQEFENLKTNSQQEKARLEAQIKEAEIENKGKELKILELEELVTNHQRTIFHLVKSSQQEKMLLEDQIREKDTEITNCQSDLEQISRTHLEIKNQLEIQIQEVQDKREYIYHLEKKLYYHMDELAAKERELENDRHRFANLEWDIEASRLRMNELLATVSRLETENEDVHRENCDLLTRLCIFEDLSHAMDLMLEAETKNDEELSALECREQEHLKTISDLKETSLQEKTQLQKDAEMESDRQKSKIKELEELLTNVQSREREYLKQISDLEKNSQNEKSHLMAQIQEMENAMINARVPLESSVDDIIDVKVEEKEIIPSKSRDNDKNTGEKWKKGLLIGGGCLVAAVALWKYGPDVSGLASALNQPRLTGNLL